MDIVAAGQLTADVVVAVAEQINEMLLSHVAVHHFLHIEFSHGGQQPEKFVIDVLITAHMLMRAAHLPKKRDGQIGLSSSFYFFVGCLLHKKLQPLAQPEFSYTNYVFCTIQTRSFQSKSPFTRFTASSFFRLTIFAYTCVMRTSVCPSSLLVVLLVDKYVLPMAKGKSPQQDAVLVKDYIMEVNVHSFFVPDPHDRIQSVFDSFLNYKNITARVDTYKNGGDIDDTEVSISYSTFKQLYYNVEPKKDLLHAALYSELMCRLTILKLCTEEIFKCDGLSGIIRTIETLSLPSQNIKDGITKLRSHRYFHLYPHFWQIFIYVFGGFILTCKKDEEYAILSKLTDIPVDEIDNALSAFDILFPLDDKSWLFDKPYTHIKILQLMPLVFSGLGAHFRRIVYSDDIEKCLYEDLGKKLPDDFTLNDLIKFNNLAAAYFPHDK